jgi:hypothetical protein
VAKRANFIERLIKDVWAEMGCPPMPDIVGGTRKKIELGVDSDKLLALYNTFGTERYKWAFQDARISRELSAKSVAQRVRDGYWGSLKKHLVDGGDLTNEILSLLAEILDGKKRLPNRPPSYDIYIRDKGIARAVVDRVMAGQSSEAAYQAAADQYGISKRQTERICVKYAEDAVWAILCNGVWNHFQDQWRDARELILAELARRNIAPARYSVCNTALTPHFMS